MSQAAHLLTEARALIERGWTQGASARDKNGDVVSVASVRAVCWCPLGAIRSVTRGLDNAAVLDQNLRARFTLACPVYINHSASYSGAAWFSIAAWNDEHTTTQDDVLSAFTKAIHDAEEADEEES